MKLLDTQIENIRDKMVNNIDINIYRKESIKRKENSLMVAL
jgi:hypothetical protein